MTAGEPSLVGRDAERQQLARLLDGLPAADGVTLQVAGEPGIGKSRLLRELCAQAETRGHLVLAGRAAEFEAELPFGVFDDALGDWLMALGPERREVVAGGLGAELAVVLPAFQALAAGRAPAIEQERYRSYRAVRGLLSRLAESAAVVLVLDDVQWADPGSCELVSHLLAHPPRGTVLVAIAFRPAQISPQLDAVLEAARRQPQGMRFDLAPLAPAAAGELLGPGLPSAVRDRLYRESGGNPFFLLQLARGAALAAGSFAAGAGGASSVPRPVRAAMASELSSLSTPSLVLLQGAAVAGDPFEVRLAACAADVGDADALGSLDELLQRQLVHPTAVLGQFAFRHPIVRSTVYELAAGTWRVRAHARVAALLAAASAGASARAPHLERSAAHGDADAVKVLVDAGRMSAPRAPALAARWFGAALRLLPEQTEVEGQRIELLIATATALGASGQLERSRSTLVEVLERLPPGAPGRVSIIAYCAGVEHLLGRHRDAHARLALAHRAQRGSRSLDAVLLELELAAGAGYETRAEDMIGWAERALEGATQLGHPELEVAAAGQVALARYFLGLDAAEAIDQAAAGLDALDDAELARRLDIGLWVGWTESVLERHERAVEHCQRVIDVARATGQGATLLVTMTAQAWSLLRMGRLDDAGETLAAANEAGHLAPNVFLAIAVGLSAVLATHRGQYAAAVALGEESVALARSADAGLLPGMSGLYLATPLIEIGEARRARDIVLAMSGGGGGGLRTSRSGHTAAYEVLTRAELILGRLDEADRWARKARAATHGGQLAAEAAFASRAAAAVAVARGDAAGAARLTLDAAVRADAGGAPIEAGRCRILAAKAFVESGRPVEAVAALERATTDLGRIGADGYRAQADKALRRLRRSAGDAEANVGGLGSLTERERRLAELVSRGLTNRELAAATHFSEKTVERQLSRVFAKLGVSRRTQVAAMIAAERDG